MSRGALAIGVEPVQLIHFLIGLSDQVIDIFVSRIERLHILEFTQRILIFSTDSCTRCPQFQQFPLNQYVLLFQRLSDRLAR